MDISRAFQTSSDTVSYFFKQGGTGYYIPLYQREYSWDDENIEQLMDDICSGVFDLLTGEDKIHFMGTIILVMENDVANQIKPQDHRAIPSRIDNVIDGQQRISTIALLACCLYQKIYEVKEKLPQLSDLEGLREVAETYLVNLKELFSFDLMRGQPKRKPIIIRGSLDGWTLDGQESKHYQSDISSYLANFIRAINDNSNQFPKARRKSLVADNIKLIQEWLDKVKTAHQGKHDDYPPAWNIIENIKQSELWDYERPELFQSVKDCENIEPNSLDRNQEYICPLVQLFAFSSYLLERCCFTVIKPVSELRAFDMFQSLNATGTPLTAIETFKPLVVNIADSKASGFKNSSFEESFTQVEQLMKNLRSASSKNKRTNEYLTLFSLTYEGKSLSKQFSTQRKWLSEKFQKDCCYSENQESSIEDKTEFIQQMGDVAIYCQKVIYSSANLKDSLPELRPLSELERKLASFCLLYLQEANHKMAHTILSRFYALAIRTQNNSKDLEEENQKKAQQNFATACQIVAAFFTLWRSALPNTGLDNVYRNLLQKQMSWKQGNSEVTIENLKTHFKNALQDKGIGTKETWINKAINYLRYDNVKKVCRFVLFITSQDTIPDPNELGLMTKGTTKSSSLYWEPSQWLSEDLKTIEHIAPQNVQADATWDKALYDNDDYEQIGNLTLLPKEINTSAGNREWIEKWIYYGHLAETNPNKLTELGQEARTYKVNLNDYTIRLLTKASHAHHIKPIVEIGATGKWDKELVKKRTQRICEILWKRMYEEWLS
jgi:hypothetical protein